MPKSTAIDQNLDQIFAKLAKENPSPQTELKYSNNYTLLIAVLLSAQSTDLMVNKVTQPLFTICNTPEAMLALGEEKLKNYINKIGLFNNKAKNIIALSKILIDQYESQVPDNLESLVKLPGVGRKTANVVLNCAFGKPTMPVDTHVFRVATRIGLSSAKTPEQMEHDLISMIDKKWMTNAHHWLILHGRYICKARNPKCSECIISEFCQYNKQHNV